MGRLRQNDIRLWEATALFLAYRERALTRHENLSEAFRDNKLYYINTSIGLTLWAGTDLDVGTLTLCSVQPFFHAPGPRPVGGKAP